MKEAHVEREVAQAKIDLFGAIVAQCDREKYNTLTAVFQRAKDKLTKLREKKPSAIVAMALTADENDLHLRAPFDGPIKNVRVSAFLGDLASGIGVNVKYMIEACESFKRDRRVKIELRDAFTPIIIRGETGFELIMPVRL